MFKKRNISLTEGPILSSVIIYAIPIVLSGMLQILFNAADLAVVGRFSETKTTATAAVGATGSIISLIVNTVMGLSVGVNVMLSRSLGSGDRQRSSRTVHTALLLSGVSGIFIAIIGALIARPAMVATDCPKGALDMAVQYMVIYFIGAPGIMVYNFGSAILRTKGDTKRPLYFLALSGVLNVVMNVIFVAAFHMEAAGVALATTISQYFAAYLTVRSLTKQEDECRLYIRHLKVYKDELIGIIKYGLPSGITQAMYSISNVQIQSALNFYGESAISGNSACGSLEGFVAAGTSAFNAATVAFVGQNVGAGKKERVKKVFSVCLFVAVSYAVILGFSLFIFAEPIIKNIYLPKDPKGVSVAVLRASFMFTTYFIAAMMNIFAGASQAFGYAAPLMVNSIVGIFGIRTVWMQFVYPKSPSLEMLYICYPMTWTFILLSNMAVFFIAYRKYSLKGKVI